MIRLLRFVALRRLDREKLRTLITLLGIALGVAVVLAVELANRATIHSVEVMVDDIAGRARLSVRGDAAGFPDSLLAIVASHPGVEAALPVVGATALHEETELTLIVLGVDLLSDAGPRGYDAEIKDPLALVSRPDRALISSLYAREHGLKPGSTMTLVTARGALPVEVGGIIRSGGPSQAFGGKVVLMDIRAAQFLFERRDRLDRIDIVPAPRFQGRSTAEPGGLVALRADLRRALPPGLGVESPADQAAQAADLLASFQVNLRMVSTVALFVGMFLVYNTMSIAVVQRRRETGILRALGVPRRRILTLFTVQGLVYGLVGSGLGVVIGVLLARAALSAIAGTVTRSYLLVEATRVPLSWPAIIACTGMGLVVSTAAAWLPGREAAGLPPAVTIRELPFQESRRGRSLLLAAAGVALLALAWFFSRLPPLYGVAFFGYASGFAIVFGFAGFSPAACLLFGRLSRRWLGRGFGVEGRLAAGNLTRTVGRAALSVSALMTALALVICVATMIHSFKKSIVIWITNTISADLLVRSGSGESALASIPFTGAFEDSLARIPGVERVNSFRFAASRYAGRSIALCSLPLRAWLAHNPVVSTRRRLAGPPQADWAVISDNFAVHFHKTSGDTIRLLSPSGPVTFRVGLVFLDYTSDQGSVFIDRDVYRRAWGDALVDTYGLYLRKGTPAAAVRRELEARYGRRHHLFLSSNVDLRNQILRNVDSTFAVVYALEAIALAIAVLGVVNTLVASTLDRRRELGLLRAVGATRRQVGRLFILEAAGMGIVGVTLGLGAGYALSLLLVHVIQFQSTGWRFLYHFPWAIVAGTSAVTLLAAAAAGYYPARIGARTWGVESLQYE